MKSMKWLSMLMATCMLALCLLLAVVPAAWAEEGEILAAPVDADVEELESTDLWTEDIAKAVEEAEAAKQEAAAAPKEDDIPIDEEHFPDDTFRGIVGASDIDADGNGALSKEEREAVTELILVQRSPYDATGTGNNYHFDTLAGIEYFPNLVKLVCYDADLPELDVSRNTALEDLECDRNRLYSLNVSGCEALKTLNCWANSLKRLDLSQNPALTSLVCGDNTLASLDLSQNPALTSLDCRRDPLASLDLSHNPALTSLDCSSCPLVQLDLSHNPALTNLCVDFSDIAGLNLSGSTALNTLCCRSNKLAELDVSGCPNLENVYGQYGTMTRLNANGCSKLKKLYCFHNQLTSLTVKDCTDIEELHCYGNQLTVLDVTTCTHVMDGVRAGASSGTIDGLPVAIYRASINGQTYTVLKVDAAVELNPVEPDPIPIADCEITGVKAHTYTGKAIKPNPVVKYDGVKLVKGTDYTVAYKNNKAVGTATVTVKGIGNYTGTAKKTFKINPKKVAVSKLTAGKKKLTVQWKKTAGAGYQIQYGLKKNFSGAKTVTITKTATVKKVLKNLRSGKIYYVRIRGYKKVGGKKYVSAWSKAKKAKVK